MHLNKSQVLQMQWKRRVKVKIFELVDHTIVKKKSAPKPQIVKVIRADASGVELAFLRTSERIRSC